MPVIANKTVSVATLLCASALAACAAPAAQALQSASATASTGAAIAPGQAAPTSSATPPAPQPTGRGQEGVSLATWFGPGLFGRHTACGQLLTRQLVGVASRSLPCGTLVAFNYHGREVVAPVVDRGPYRSIGANWDLTLRAAKLLKMGGTARLGAKVIGHVQNSPELGAPAGHSAASADSSTSPSAGPTGGVTAS